MRSHGEGSSSGSWEREASVAVRRRYGRPAVEAVCCLTCCNRGLLVTCECALNRCLSVGTRLAAELQSCWTCGESARHSRCQRPQLSLEALTQAVSGLCPVSAVIQPKLSRAVDCCEKLRRVFSRAKLEVDVGQSRPPVGRSVSFELSLRAAAAQPAAWSARLPSCPTAAQSYTVSVI